MPPLTREYLLSRGKCCHNGCMNCPYKESKMKRYLVFAYDKYYPVGGWDDFKKCFDTLEEAERFQLQLSHYDYVEIIDTQDPTNF